MSLNEMFQKKDMGLFSKEEAPITSCYSKTMDQWKNELNAGKWSHGHPLGEGTLFVPSNVSAGYEAQSGVLSLRLVSGLEQYLLCAGSHNGTTVKHGISDVVDSIIRALREFDEESRNKIAEAISQP